MRRRTKVSKKYNSELNPLYKQKYSDELRNIEISLQESYQSQIAYDEEKAVTVMPLKLTLNTSSHMPRNETNSGLLLDLL